MNSHMTEFLREWFKMNQAASRFSDTLMSMMFISKKKI